jgi:uncharacterized protein YutE (UPF0331/DUF86 family)
MVAGYINEKVITQRALWISQMIDALKDLPIENREKFFQNKHNIAAAESYIRRALEALFDIGRHILAKRFAYPASEYKEIVTGLFEKQVIEKKDADLMKKMAGYRNRMVHFYHEISSDELYEICLKHIDEINQLLECLIKWIKEDKEKNESLK